MLVPLRRLLHGRARLLGDTAWAGVGEGAQIAATLTVFYLLTTRLGPAEYGYFVGVQALVAMLAMVSSGWIALLLVQEQVRARRPAAEVYPACLTLALLLVVPAVAAAVGLGAVLLPGLGLATVALFAVAELLGSGAVSLAAALLQASDRFGASARLKTGYLVGRVVVVVVLLLTAGLEIERVALAYAGYGLLAGTAVTLWVSRRNALPLRPRLPEMSQVRSGLTYAGTSALFAVQEDADKTLLVRLGDPVTAGLYGAAYRGVQLGVMPVRALLSATHRRFLLDDGTPGLHARRSWRFTLVGLAWGVPATLVLALGAPLVPVLLGEQYRGSVELVVLLAALVALRAGSLFAFNGLLGLHRNATRVVVLAVSAVVAVGALFALVPAYGARGAAGATLLSEVVFVSLTWAMLLRAQRAADRQARPSSLQPV